jgi:hypothetical protein
MSSTTQAVPGTARAALATARPAERRARTRRRAQVALAGLTVGSLALLVDLLLAGHTVGEEIWGPVTALAATVTGTLSLVYVAVAARSRAARLVLYSLWVLVGFFGFGGYNDHRLPRPVDTITDQRERPPLAPLAFTAMAVAGAVALRSGSKGE